MKHIKGKEIILWIDNYLADPRLKPEEQLRKRWAWIWMVVTFFGVLFTVFFFLFILKLWPIWWTGVAFITCYLISFPIYKRSKRFDLVINLMFSVFIILIFFALIQVGGLSTSLGFVFIGVNCAMGSVLAGRIKWTIGLFTLYCSSIITLGVLQPYLQTPDYITPQINTIAFVSLTLWVNACILFLMILFMKDISRLEKSEADKLRKIDEVKTQLYTNLSHEFRTPLTIINGIAEQLEKKPDKWIKKEPFKIKTQSNVLLRLINQMLDISKIEAGVMTLNLIQGDINEFIIFIINSFNNLAENNNINLTINTYHKTIYTDYDPEKLMHILTNLMSNAIKFTPKGGTIIVDILRDNEKMKIYVRDTGKGISQEDIKHIFDRFYQASDNNNSIQGTGLGLALTKELINILKGTIEVKSKVSLGTEFLVILPISNEKSLEIDNGISFINPATIHSIIPLDDTDRTIRYYPKTTPNNPIVLIVEDNKDLIEHLIFILENQYSIVTASNGMLGLKKSKEIIPDIIITDIMMPKMDGFELIKKLKTEISTDHIPIIVLTARGDFNSKLSGLEIGADHYLTKPFSEKELLLKIKNLLCNRENMQKKLGVLSPAFKHKNKNYRQEVSFMLRINNLIDEQLDNDDFGIKDICSALNFSRPQLYRKFSALTNKSIGKYIKLYRLHKAKVMIEVDGKNVSEAAQDSGFKNLSHFSSSFHKEFGFPPSELL